MGEPTTTTESQFPDDIDGVFFSYESGPVDERTHAKAEKDNFKEQKIKRLQEYVGVHHTQGWDPANPLAPPASRETINERLTKIGGTGGFIEQGIINNFSGTGGIDPTGLILGKTGELPEFVIPPTGCIPLQPPSPVGIFNPVFPEEPPYPTPTPTGYPTNPFDPDLWPWPNPGFDPDTPDAYPMGPWMQWVTWAIGYSQVAWQVQNAGNINFGPFGLPFANLPGPWKDVINLLRVYTITHAEMPAGAGQPLYDDPNTLYRASLLNVLDSTLSVVSQLVGGWGVEIHKLVGNGTTTISHWFANGFNAGELSGDHAAIFKVVSPDGTYDINEVGTSLTGFQGPGAYDVKFDAAPPSGAIIFLVCQNARPSIATEGGPAMWVTEKLTPSPADTFTLTYVPADGDIGKVLDVEASIVAGGPYVHLADNGTGSATSADDFGTSLSAGVFKVLTNAAQAYGEIEVKYLRDVNYA